MCYKVGPCWLSILNIGMPTCASQTSQTLKQLKRRKNSHGHCIRPPFSLVQSFSHVCLFATPWTPAHQASLPITNSWSLLKLTSIKSVMPSNHLILCHLLLLLPSIIPRIRDFHMSQFFASGGQSIGVSASASVLPMNIQG